MYRYDVNVTLVTREGFSYEYCFEVVADTSIESIHMTLEGLDSIFPKYTISFLSTKKGQEI